MIGSFPSLAKKREQAVRRANYPTSPAYSPYYLSLLTVTTMTMHPLMATLRMEEEATTFEGRTVFGGIGFPLARVELLPSYTR